MTNKVPLRSRAGSVRVAVTAIVASIVMGTLLAGPASAAENKNELLQLSSDGVNFATGALPTMFRSTKGYVPGESRRGIIWVRNASSQPASISLSVRNTSTSTTSLLPGRLRLQALSPGRNAAAASLPAGGACTPVVDAWTLAAGTVLPLTLDLGMALDSPNSTRNQTADFVLTFVLQEQGPGKLIDPCSGTPGKPLAGEGVTSVVVGGGTSGTANGAGVLKSNGAVAGVDESLRSPGWDPQPSGTEPLPEALPLFRQLQSNVEATRYNPWTWIVLVSGCVYMFVLSRKRSTTQ